MKIYKLIHNATDTSSVQFHQVTAVTAITLRDRQTHSQL
jgi:hypothetical protein